MGELFDIVRRKRAALLRAATFMAAALFLLLYIGVATVAYAQSLEIKPNGTTAQVTEFPLDSGVLRDSLKAYLSIQQPLKKNTETGALPVGAIDTNMGEMKALPPDSPLARSAKPTVGRAALVSLVYGTLSGTTATFITTLPQVNTISSDTYAAGFPTGYAPPSFITHQTISVSAPVSIRGNPVITHKITIASNAVPGTYSFDVQYAFYTSGGVFVALEWIDFTVVIRASAIDLSASAIDFGNVTVGSSSNKSFTITHRISRGLGYSLVSPAGVSIAPSDTLFALTNPGDSREIHLTFSPSTAGDLSGNISLVYADASGEIARIVLIPVTGKATQPSAPIISISPSSVTFDPTTVGQSSQKTFTITNTGNASLSVTGITVSGTDASRFTVSPTTVTVAAGQSQTITVTFAPTSTGTKSASLSIAHNASGSPSSVSLTGNGTALPAPAISLSSTNLSFGDVQVGQNKALTFTVGNTGNATLSISNITSSNSQFTVSPASFSVTSGAAAQTVTVTFTPSGTGSQTGTLSITHNASGSPSSVSLTGNGTAPPAPAISLSSTSLPFGDVQVGQNKALTFTVGNTGNATLSISNITSNNSQFTVSPASFSVTSGAAAQTVTVTFTPSGTGSQTGTVSIAHNASGSPSSVSLTGNGTATPPSPAPIISLSSTSLSFGDVQVGQNKALTFTVGNTGNAALSVSNITSGNGQFTVSPTSFSVASGASAQP